LIEEPTPEATLAHLAERHDDSFLRRRLALEAAIAARAQRKQKTKLSDWLVQPWLVRAALRTVLLHGRARRNALDFRVRHHTLRLPRLPAAFDGYRLLQLSDLHADMNAAFPAALAARLQALDGDYDACVLTGDYRYQIHGPVAPALAGMATICAALRRPIYGILGNHDSLRMVPTLETRFGVRMLINEGLRLQRDDATLWLLGVDDSHYYRTADGARAARERDSGTAALLLAHTPAFFRDAARLDIDAMLSGHTHGGQLCLPGGWPLIYDADCPRRLAAGTWRIGELYGYTSVGAGASVADVRLNCPPEIVIHTLRGA
jgi:predicted MPP superfamily phosphohydrolase